MESERWVSYIYRYRRKSENTFRENASENCKSTEREKTSENNESMLHENADGRCENAGFVKVQRLTYPTRLKVPRLSEMIDRNDETLIIPGRSVARIQIGLRLYKQYECDCKVYAIRQAVQDKEKCAVMLGQFVIKAEERDAIVRKYETYWDNVLKTGLGIEEFDGLIFECDDGERMLSLWGSSEIKPYACELPGKKEAISKEKSENVRVNEPLQNDPQSAAVLEEPEMRLPTDWHQLFSTRPELMDIIVPVKRSGRELRISAVKISPQDIGILPMQNWKYGVNSFLAHGYYKYNYIMFGKMVKNGSFQYILGVPGTNTCKERYMANMFGFRNFVPAPDITNSSANEGIFGYWITGIAA